MAAPLITILDASNTSLIVNWDVGNIKAQVPTAPLEINIWNNKDGMTDVSDLKEVEIMVLDDNGTTYESEVPQNKWVQVNNIGTDGDKTTFTAIGAEVTKKIRANGGVSTEYCIKGTANDGNPDNYPQNVASAQLRLVAPMNSTPGDKSFKIRIVGYYT